MGVLGFMMAFNVVYYQFSISSATILFFVPFTYYLVLDSRGDTPELHKALKYFNLEGSALRDTASTLTSSPTISLAIFCDSVVFRFCRYGLDSPHVLILSKSFTSKVEN